MNASRVSRPLSLGLCVAVTLWGCGGGTEPHGVAHHLAGTWKLIEHVEGQGGSVVCDDTASIGVTQADALLTLSGGGAVHCRWASGDSVSDWASYAVTARLDGNTVTVADPDCPYVGSVNATDDVVAGTEDCAGSSLGVSGRVTGPWRLARTETEPPSVTVSVGPTGLTQGDTADFAVQASDAGGLARIGVVAVMQGSSPRNDDCPEAGDTVRDSVVVSGSSAAHTFRAMVPGCTAAVAVTAFALDTAGNRGEQGQFQLVRLPISTLEASLSDTIFMLGDTARVTITASNPDGLAWVGVRWTFNTFLGQDSLPVSGTSATRTFAVRVPPEGPPVNLTARVFARHRYGWPTTVELPSAHTTDELIVPVQSLSLPGAPGDWVWGLKRDRVYFSYRGVPSVSEVGLAPLAELGSYALGGPAVSLDLTESEDSLVVGRADSLLLGVIPLGGGPATGIPVVPPDTVDLYGVFRLRVVAGGRVFIGVASGGAGSIQELLLGTGTQRTRGSWFNAGSVERMRRDRLLFLDATSPVGSRLYLAATDTLLPEAWDVVHGSSPVADTAGARWMVGSELFDAGLNLLRGMGDEQRYQPCGLAPDGSRAYCGLYDGFTEYDAATGLKLKAVHLPARPDRLLALGGGRVLAISGSTLYLVTVP